MNQANQYDCKVFLKNLKIQQEMVIDNDAQIVPSNMGYTCYDPLRYMINYLETVTGERVNIDSENLVKRYSKDMPVTVIKLWNIRALNLRSASEIAMEKSQSIIKFLAYNQVQSPEAFGVTSSRKGEGTYVLVYPPNSCQWKLHLMNDINAMARYTTKRLEKDVKLNLFLSLFADAVAEQKLDFKIVKLWTILETMAISYNQYHHHEQNVRELLKDYQIGIQKFEEFDLIKLAYKHRNAIVHEGTSDPKIVSPEFAKFLVVSTKNITKITSDLQELVSFVINCYMQRTAKS